METQTQNSSIEKAQQPARRIGGGLIASVVVISFLIGTLSGVFGASLVVYGLKNPFKLNGSQAATQTTVSSTADQQIINVVKTASPAVVSIVASKSVPVQSQQDYSYNNPFYFPFFQFQMPGQGNNNSSSGSGKSTYQDVSAGSGFFITSEGLIVTNKHVVSDATAKYTVVTNDGKRYPATVVGQDPINDIALVKVNISNASTLSFDDSGKIQIGQAVIAIGNSLGQYQNTVTSGIVSGIGRDITAGGEDLSESLEGVIQTDAAINPGNSGGPLLDLSGKVIGMNTAMDQQGQLVGFAIPSADLLKDIQSYKQNNKIVKAFLGVRYLQITSDLQQQFNLPVSTGAWVTSKGDTTGSNGQVVLPGSAADKAGLKDGDIITAFNGTQLNESISLAGLMKNANPGDKVVLDILRDGKKMQLTVTLGQK